MRRRLLQKRLLNELEDRKRDYLTERIVNIRVTHKKASVSSLEVLAFKDPEIALNEINSFDHVLECFILQTCNRVEIYALVSSSDKGSWESEIVGYWRQKIGYVSDDFYRHVESSSGLKALFHLFRLSSGLESMVVGEDQILGQIEDAYDEAKRCNTVGPVLQNVFERAIRTGKMVRFKTKINKGAVSMGSIAVNLLEDSIHDLTEKTIMIIGAGETGALVGKALAVRKSATIFVANRTFKRAVKLAESFDGKAIKFKSLKQPLSSVDAVIVATAPPHYILTHDLVSEVMDHRGNKELLIIDLAQPKNVEKTVANLPNVKLLNIDNLREIARTNLENRLKEVEKAGEMITDELQQMMFMLKRNHVEPTISAIYSKAEEIRGKEVRKALKMMRKLNGLHSSQEDRCSHCVKIIEDLSHVLMERLLSHPITNLRKAAVVDDYKAVSIAKKLFNIETENETQT